MINFKFVRSQFKNIGIPLIIFLVVLLILLLPALTQSYLAPTMEWIGFNGGWSGGSHGDGAIPLLSYTFFGPPGLIALVAFSLILNHILVSKEIDKGYLASWLTMPMSRKTIFNSKLFVFLSAILSIYTIALLVQLIIFPIKFQDFKIQEFGYLILYNLGFILLALLWASINWIFIGAFNKSAISLSIAAGVSVFFVLCITISLFSFIPGKEFFKYFRYATIGIFFNSPFKFGELPNIRPDPGTVIMDKAPLFTLKPSDFVWQLPLMFVLPLLFFPLGKTFLLKKDLPL